MEIFEDVSEASIFSRAVERNYNKRKNRRNIINEFIFGKLHSTATIILSLITLLVFGYLLKS